ncbi:4-alpha-glucanotransferase [Chloroflexota bacterium]
MSHASNIRLLHQLARYCGIQTAYYDVNRHRQQASTESLVAMLGVLGVPITTQQDAASAWRERHQSLWQQLLEPVTIAWDDEPPTVQVRLPLDIAEANLNCNIKLENGEKQSSDWHGADLPGSETAEVEGKRYIVKQLRLPARLPWGYYRLTLEIAGRYAETVIISAPLKAYTLSEEANNKMWGAFLPLYALHTDRSWGGGDFSDLGALASWVAGMGGSVVATLPLLATMLNDIYETSPYLPASRLLWNEFYLDIHEIQELSKCPSAQAFLASSSLQKEIADLRQLSLVDYRRQMDLKRRVLEELCQCIFAEPSQRLNDLQEYANQNDVVVDYARFRATCEKQQISWRSWPQRLRDGFLSESDYDESSHRYHLYVQWLAHQQMENLAKKIRGEGLQLYLDLPLGVHPDGYDVWREHEAFIPNTSAGAPPDAVFTKGQNWELPPLHPEKIREQGYRYIISCLRKHLQFANILRIDHVMGLHRLFCIPNGVEAGKGVYLRYRAEEIYAILALESHRHNAIIVGEDLGTVPPYVRLAMRKHKLQRMYVVQYELASDLRKGLHPVSANSVASLNTHDMPPFAAFWQGLDIKERKRIGLLNKAEVREEQSKLVKTRDALRTFLLQSGWLQESENNIAAILKAGLSFLACSKARIVLINLEDLWLEIQPQNVPSTREEYPNWQRKAKYSLEEFCQIPRVIDTLRTINELQKRVETSQNGKEIGTQKNIPKYPG